MRVLFLDIDGVLNSTQWFVKRTKQEVTSVFDRHVSDLDPETIKHLESICTAVPDLKIVISSTWRRLHSVVEIMGMLNDVGGPLSSSRIIGKTPIHNDGHRGSEIQSWLDHHRRSQQITNYVIIDDDRDFHPHQRDNHLVNTKFETGLTASDAEKAILILNKDQSFTPTV